MSKEIIWVHGGTFDPPHLGHQALCDKVLTENQGKWYFVPCFMHTEKESISPFNHRWKMAKLMWEYAREKWGERVVLSDIEARMEGPSITYKTLCQLQSEAGNALLRLVIGADLVEGLIYWEYYQKILQEFEVWVARRAGVKVNRLIQGMTWLEIPPIVGSSSVVREAVRQGKPINGMVIPRIGEYIKNNNMYAEI